jgi:hypothetical protein
LGSWKTVLNGAFVRYANVFGETPALSISDEYFWLKAVSEAGSESPPRAHPSFGAAA